VQATNEQQIKSQTTRPVEHIKDTSFPAHIINFTLSYLFTIASSSSNTNLTSLFFRFQIGPHSSFRPWETLPFFLSNINTITLLDTDWLPFAFFSLPLKLPLTIVTTEKNTLYTVLGLLASSFPFLFLCRCSIWRNARVSGRSRQAGILALVLVFGYHSNGIPLACIVIYNWDFPLSTIPLAVCWEV
jgi:hypothetical protein